MSKALAAVFPWAPRHERQAAIDAARAEKERAAADAAHARGLERDIRSLYHRNHWGAKVSDALGIDWREGNGGR